MEKHGGDNLWFYTTKASKLYTEASVDDSGEIYLVFGKETKGLPERIIETNPDTSVRLPMLPGLRSLNLSNTVAVTVYEAWRQNDYEGGRGRCGGSIRKFTVANVGVTIILR